MQWLLLMIVSIIYLCESYLSYSDAWRRSYCYLPISIGLGLFSCIIWFVTVKYLDDRQRIYIFSLFWDSAMCFAFYLVPIICYNVKLDCWSLFGLFLMVAGLTIIKIKT